MIALENKKEFIKQNHEATVKCLTNKGFKFNLPCDGSSREGLPELKDEGFTPPGGIDVELDSTLGRESVPSANEFQKSAPHSRGFGAWLPNHQPDLKSMQYCQMNSLRSHFRPLPMDARLLYARSWVVPQSYFCEFQQLQDFQYFVVIDFEATCEKGWNPHPQEIIEFPSVIVNSMTGQLEACFQTYVRPTCNQNLSDFCKDLTGIQQIQVDRGVTLNEALFRHDKWLENKGIKNTKFAVVTWSDWDCKVMLESECRYKSITKPEYFNRWINLEVPFNASFGGGKCNLKRAVEMAGLMWQGRRHSGLDDAKNTARLLTVLMRMDRLSITNSLSQNSEEVHNKTPIFPYYPRCLCGVKSCGWMVRKRGVEQCSIFFSCGKWTPTMGNQCRFFVWA